MYKFAISFCCIAYVFAEFEFVVNYNSKYFLLDTCCKSLFKYMLISLFSFLFLLDIIITLDLPSLKLILLFLDQAMILLISVFEIFSDALILLFLQANIKSSVNATALEPFVN